MHLTRPGMTIGSVYYMSPEQVRGGTVDARSDLYSFGVTLYESLTGRKPFEADTSYSVLNAHLTVAPVPPIEVNPALPPQVNQIILRALEKKPEDRFRVSHLCPRSLPLCRQPRPDSRPFRLRRYHHLLRRLRLSRPWPQRPLRPLSQPLPASQL
jgi:serine/threonine-protein kinase